MNSSLNYFDAHNHFQDSRLTPFRKKIVSDILAGGITSMVVNGSSEEDWQDVLELAQTYKWIVPAFGYHPWYLESVTQKWRTKLEDLLDSIPSTIGEIGLDRRKRGLDFEKQLEFFRIQLEIAGERNLPTSIHCIEAWGALLSTLASTKIPERGFLVHSYGGSIELIPSLVKLGAFFSFPGYYLNENKTLKLSTFKYIPLERILIETDAPDQLLPIELDSYNLNNQDLRLNHPCNIISVYKGLSLAMDVSLEKLSEQIEKNYRSLFGDCMRS
jgi:TatD DNase family protein